MSKLYRVLKLLSTGHEPGDFETADRFRPDVIPKLEAVGAIAEVHGPPLSVLEGWTRRAELLAPAGILTATDFLQADDETIMRCFSHRTNKKVKDYKKELNALLRVQAESDAAPRRSRREK